MITTGLVSVGGSAAPLCFVPPGPSSLTLVNTGTASVWIGAGGTAVTASGAGAGAVLASGAAVTLPGFRGSAPTTLYAVTGGTAITVPVSVFLSTGG